MEQSLGNLETRNCNCNKLIADCLVNRVRSLFDRHIRIYQVSLDLFLADRFVIQIFCLS